MLGGGGGTVGPTSHACCSCEGGGGGGGASGRAAGGPQVAVGIAVLASIPGVANVAAWAASCSARLLVGASVRCRAERTLRSIWDRRAEYIDFSCTDLWRMTKNTETMPITATSGPAAISSRPIGADYP